MRAINGQLLPTSVDLTPEFPAKEECQFGGTCHLFTATGLFGHACYRVTGKWIDLNENYLFLLHMYDIFKNLKFDERGFTEGVSYETFLEWRKLGSLFGNDGGDPLRGLQRICEGNCTVSAVDEPGYVARTVAGAVKWKYGVMWKLLSNRYEDEYTKARAQGTFKEFHARWLEHYKQALLAAGAKENTDHTIATATPPQLRECLNGRKWEYKRVPWSEELAYSLIAKGVPFACAGNYSETAIRGIDSSHVAIVNGYKMSETPGGVTYWKVRGADGREASKFDQPIESCTNILYVGLPAAGPPVQ